MPGTGQGSGQFGLIRGDAGFITAAAGARVALIGRWKMEPSGRKPDGTTRLRFKAQFSWKNETLLAMVGRGTLKGRVVVQMTTKHGQENVDILDWQEWRLEGGVLTLEDVTHFHGVRVARSASR